MQTNVRARHDSWRACLPVSRKPCASTTQRAAITSIEAEIGCMPKTLRRWVRQQERETGQRPGPTTADEERIKALEREVRELTGLHESRGGSNFGLARVAQRSTPAPTR